MICHDMMYTFKLKYLDGKGKVIAVMISVFALLVFIVWSSYPSVVSNKGQARGEGYDYIQARETLSVAAANASKLYGIMFDAGSTGSRIHVYIFHKGKDGSLLLDKEIFEQIKPGLSSFASNPKEGALSLKPLLDIANASIPETHKRTTPMALKATAGLRLLPQATADALLHEVEAFLKTYPFHLVKNGVAIMDGTDEGLFSWYTLNFLLGSIQDPPVTHGMMDLGGGSTQITFVPQSLYTKKHMKDDYELKVNIMDEDITLYTHSYLGLGLMSARRKMFGNPDATEVSSSCLPLGYKSSWKFDSEDLDILGVAPASGMERYEACYATAKSVVYNKVNRAKEVNHVPFYVFSYYFDRAVDAHMIGDDGGVRSVQQFMEAAKKECMNPNVDEPFLCMDLSFISALLHEGFGFNEDICLHLKKKINGVETAWSLGAMISLMKEY